MCSSSCECGLFVIWKERIVMAKGSKKSIKKELKILADDFGLLYRADVQNVIENCKNYVEGQKEMMRIYMIQCICVDRMVEVIWLLY